MRKLIFIAVLLFFTLFGFGQGGRNVGVIASSGGSASPYSAATLALIASWDYVPGADTLAQIDICMNRMNDTANLDYYHFYALTAARNNDANQNWMRPGIFNTSDPGVTNPVWTPLYGYSGNIVGGDYLSLNYNLSSDTIHAGRNHFSIGTYFMDDETSSGYDMAVTDLSAGTKITGLRSKVTGPNQMRSYLNSSDYLSASTTPGDGFIIATLNDRTGAAVQYRNGVLVSSGTVTITGAPNGDIFIFGRNLVGTGADNFTGQTIAADFGGEELSTAQQLEIADATNDLLTYFGTNVY